MNEKRFKNLNMDLYNIEFDLNNRWEEEIGNISNEEFNSPKFLSLCADTCRFIEKYDKRKTIPHASVVLLNLLLEYSQNYYNYTDDNYGYCFMRQIPTELYSFLAEGISQESTEVYDVDYNLCKRWEWFFFEVVKKKQFDLAFFQDLAADTFRFVEKYNKKEEMPRPTLKLVQLMRNYGLNCYGYLRGNGEAFVSGEIANTFNEALLTGLNCEIDVNRHPIIHVEGNCKCRIDAFTFELSEAVKNCPNWVKQRIVILWEDYDRFRLFVLT